MNAKIVKRRQMRRVGTNYGTRSRRRALVAVAVLTVAATAAKSNAGAVAPSVYWDINGTTPGSGASGTGDASGVWDTVNTFWITDPAGGGGTLSSEVGAGNTGVFSAGSDATGSSSIQLGSTTTGITHAVGGLTVEEGTINLLGNNSTATATASIINFPNAVSTINVAAGAALHTGLGGPSPAGSARQIVFTGSSTIIKTGPGYFNNFGLNGTTTTGNAKFDGKFIVSQGTMGVFLGNDNQCLGKPATFTADQLTISNNAVVKTLQNFNSVSFYPNQGITIGPGGGTFFFAGGNDYNPAYGYTTLGSIQFTTRITGGTEANRVPITIMSNTMPGGNTIGQTSGTTAFNFQDNSSSTLAPPLYAKWIIKGGEVGPVVGGTDNGLGAAPASFLADAITLDGGGLRPNATMVTPVNRGITLGASGGRFHAVGASTTWTVNSVISGVGALTVSLDINAVNKIVLNGVNTYTGGTIMTGVGGAPMQGTLQVNTNSLPGNVATDGGTLAFDQTFDGSYAGSISNAGISANPSPFILSKSNSGIVYLTTTANTYTGNTTASGGALVATNTGAFPGYTSGGKLSASGTGVIAASVGGAGQWSLSDFDTLLANATFTGGGSAGMNVDTGNTVTYASNITIAGGFAKLGGGTLTLTGTNTYGSTSAGTSVLGGVLQVSSTTNLGATNAPITLANGGTLKLLANFGPDNGGTRTITMGAGGGVLDTNGFNIPDMQTPITGPGSFTKAGGGTVVSGQNNTYAGGTILKGGTFEIINDSNLGPAGTGITFDGGMLRYRTDFAMSSRPLTVNAGGGSVDANNHALDTVGIPIEGVGAFLLTDSGGHLNGRIKTTHVRTGNLTVNNATLQMAPNGAAAGTSKVAALAITGTGHLDLTNNKLITTSPVGTTASPGVYNGVTGLIQSGRGNGTWNGASGIVTSQTDATNSILTSIGVATAQQAKNLANPTDTVVFSGQTVTGSQTLVMYTYGGDANLDGKIDISDYGRIDFNIPLGTSGWFNGDFNYDGKIDISDYGIIDFNIGIQGAQFSTGGGASGGLNVVAVPEPATSGLLGLGALGYLARRRRSRGMPR